MKRDISVVGIDIAKRVFHLVGMDKRGKIVMRKRCRRGEVLPLMANLGPTTIGMEACGGAHYWARRLREQGHEVKLMAPQFVKPYVKSNKNDECVPPFTRGILGPEIGLVLGQALRPLVYDHS